MSGDRAELGGLRAQTARRDATQMRAATLAALSSRRATIGQVLELACSEQGAAVRRLRLTRVLRAAGHPRREIDRVLGLTSAVLDTDVGDWTVGDLVSARRGGRAIIALSDALRPRQAPGFPWATP